MSTNISKIKAAVSNLPLFHLHHCMDLKNLSPEFWGRGYMSQEYAMEGIFSYYV